MMRFIRRQLATTKKNKKKNRNQKRSISPKSIVSGLKHLWRSFRVGRQEDAHECLRTIVDGMHRSNLRAGNMSSDDVGPLSETTKMHRIFGTQCELLF